jgi:hypothetical protein
MKEKKYESYKARAWAWAATWIEEDAKAGAGREHEHILKSIVPSLKRQAARVERNAKNKVKEVARKKAQHKLGRPPAKAFDVLKLNSRNKWVRDDGKPGRAFSGKRSYVDGNAVRSAIPVAFMPDCDCSMFDRNCPGKLARDKTTERFGAAYGSRF